MENSFLKLSFGKKLLTHHAVEKTAGRRRSEHFGADSHRHVGVGAFGDFISFIDAYFLKELLRIRTSYRGLVVEERIA